MLKLKYAKKLIFILLALFAMVVGYGGSCDFGANDSGSSVAPDAPSGLIVTKNGSIATLDWTDNSDNETKFELQRKDFLSLWLFVWVKDIGSNYTTTDDTFNGLTTYRIRAYNSAGYSSYSNEAVVIP